jgi:hypothetical protein
VNPPSYEQAGSYAAFQDRMTLAALMTPDAGVGAFAMRGGVRPSSSGTGLQVTQDATADMNVLVATGTVFVPASILTNAGWTCHNNGTVSLGVNAASAANPRIDLVIAHVYDATDDSGTQNAWALEVVAGTPAASPHAPSVPTNAVVLAQVAVAKNATTITNGNITDVRPQTVALGGVLPCASTAMPATPYAGQCCYQTDTGLVVAWNGSTWRYVSPGQQTASTTAAQQITTTSDSLITGLQLNVAAGTYKIRALIALTADQNGGSANTFLHASNWASGAVGFRYSGGSVAPGANWGVPGGGTAGGGGPTMVSGTLYWHELEGLMTFSAASALSMQAHCSPAGDTFHVQPYSSMTLTPQ